MFNKFAEEKKPYRQEYYNNLLINTLKFKSLGEDVEYTNAAIESYNHYNVFKSLKIVKPNENKNRIYVRDEKGEEYHIYADLMNGWWYVVKILLGIKNKNVY